MIQEEKETFKEIFYFFLLQLTYICSVNFCSTAKWCNHTYRYVLCLRLSSIMLHRKWLNIVPCAIQQGLIAYPLHTLSFASTNPKLPVHPTPSPSATTSLFSKSMSLFLFGRLVHLTFLNVGIMWYIDEIERLCKILWSEPSDLPTVSHGSCFWFLHRELCLHECGEGAQKDASARWADSALFSASWSCSDLPHASFISWVHLQILFFHNCWLVRHFIIYRNLFFPKKRPCNPPLPPSWSSI